VEDPEVSLDDRVFGTIDPEKVAFVCRVEVFGCLYGSRYSFRMRLFEDVSLVVELGELRLRSSGRVGHKRRSLSIGDEEIYFWWCDTLPRICLELLFVQAEA
jgi:hypothetical protein